MSTLKKTLQLSSVLSVLLLATPIIWLKIGPGGYQYYGAAVPDIYILGGFILGKDLSFDPIRFAYQFQLCVILYFSISNYVLSFSSSTRIKRFTILNSILLLLFPYWIYLYTEGVFHNSDSADLSIYPHLGAIIYLALCYLNFKIYCAINNSAGILNK